MKTMRADIIEYWNFVKSKYPNAVLDYWFGTGELIFYKTPERENPSTCYKKNGVMVIEDDF